VFLWFFPAAGLFQTTTSAPDLTADVVTIQNALNSSMPFCYVTHAGASLEKIFDINYDPYNIGGPLTTDTSAPMPTWDFSFDVPILTGMGNGLWCNKDCNSNPVHHVDLVFVAPTENGQPTGYGAMAGAASGFNAAFTAIIYISLLLFYLRIGRRFFQ
jgi:hypothetical protein